MSTHNLCFEQKYEKISEFLSENFQFLVLKFSIYLDRLVFVMNIQNSFIMFYSIYLFNSIYHLAQVIFRAFP